MKSENGEENGVPPLACLKDAHPRNACCAAEAQSIASHCCGSCRAAKLLLLVQVAADFAFIPFGGGARKCVGDQFALMEATVALAMLLRSGSVNGLFDVR